MDYPASQQMKKVGKWERALQGYTGQGSTHALPLLLPCHASLESEFRSIMLRSASKKEAQA
jgi:hypothetical protein